jgi:glycosyltransferase involved in cell wall biosynthesis
VVPIENPLPAEYLGLPFEAEREPRIGFVGAWLPRKGIARIVRELPSVLREFPAWRLSLVGVGDGFRAGDHFPADVVPSVEVVPATDRASLLKAHYPRFAIVLLPSIYESFGLAAAEAMACGAALVASPVGFAHSLRAGQEALLVSEAQGSGLGEAVRRLITDEPLRRGIARAGHSRVQALRWTSAVGRLEATYRGWLAGQRRTGSSGQAA